MLFRSDFHLEEGVVLGVICSDADVPDSGAADGKFRTVFEDGTTLEYDKIEHKLTATVQGTVEIIATEGVAVTGNLTISGNLAFSGTLSGGTGPNALGFDGAILTAGDMKAGTISLKSHIHGGVQPGGGVTGPAE